MPQSILDREPPPADRRLQYDAGAFQFGDLRIPESNGPYPCVIAIHGGFWRNAYSLDHLGHLCAALTAQGIATWNIEYRRVGDPGGGWPGTFRDVTAAARYLFANVSELGLDSTRIVVLGHSAGGHLASWLASMANVPPGSPIRAECLDFRGAVSLAGVLGLQRAWELNLSNGAVRGFLGGTPDEVPERYVAASPFELLPSAIPHLVVHGGMDRNVPIEISESFATSALGRGATVRLLTFPDADHFDLIDPESALWPQLADVIRTMVEV